MFKIRRKKKDQPTKNIQAADPNKSVAHSVLKARAIASVWGIG